MCVCVRVCARVVRLCTGACVPEECVPDVLTQEMISINVTNQGL